MIVKLILFAGLTASSAFLTHWMGLTASRFAILDVPNHRSSHSRPTPRIGGVAIAGVVLLSTLAFSLTGALAPDIAWAVVPSGIAIAAVGLLDDVRGGVSAWMRIVIQMASVAWFIVAIGGAPTFGVAALEASAVLRNAIVFVGLLWMLNLFNFMDGIDGIAGSESVFTALGLVAIIGLGFGRSDAASLPLIVGGASLGFLCWNWPPARVFMGDAGSGFLGFMMGVLIVLADVEWGLSLAVPLILLAVFIVDATVTLVRRFVVGDKWYEAHRSHGYQRLSRRFKSHGVVTLGVVLVNVFWLLPLAIAAASWPDRAALLAAIAFLPLVSASLWIAKLPA
jgi:Fuc2NAc and GlcNAc transferase